MIEVKITADQIQRAEKLYPFENLKDSIMKGSSDIYGALGEIIVQDYFKKVGKNVDHTGNYDYDMLIDDKKVEVKTKKVFKLNTEYVLASVSAHNIRQKCDFYFFCQVSSDKSTGWLLGYKSKMDFLKEAFFIGKGEEDDDGFIFKGDCYNLRIKDLNKFKNEF